MFGINEIEINKLKINKTISAVIVAIILILVVVILLTIVLNWSQLFTSKQVDKTSNFKIENTVVQNVTVINLTTTDTTPDLNGTIGDLKATLSLIVDGETYVPTRNGTVWSTTITSDLAVGTYDVNICSTDITGIVVCDNSIDELVIYKIIEENPCPNGYVLVPNNIIYNTGDFCVMQFEAKIDQDSDGTGDSNESCECKNYNVWNNSASSCAYTKSERLIVSTIEGYPLTKISWTDAKAACESIGIGYHLITNEEWMTIARNIESQSINWSGRVVGLGFIPRGNSDSFYTFDDATVLDGIHQRNLILSNKKQIYDLAGNVAEWVDQTIRIIDMPPVDSTGWIEYTGVTNYGVFDRKAYNFVEGKEYSSINGIGQLYDYYSEDLSGEKVFLRGGYFTLGSGAGLLSLILGSESSIQRYYSGFRCSVVP